MCVFVCQWAHLMNESPTFVYFVFLVSAVLFSLAIPCNNIQTLLLLSNILDITKQVLMLLLSLLCVIYLQFCCFYFVHSAQHC